MGDERINGTGEQDDGRLADEPAGEAIFEGAATGSMVGPLGLLGGIVLGWLVSRAARRRRR